jgi:hypothetical protein
VACDERIHQRGMEGRVNDSQIAWTIIVSTLSGLNLSLYRDKLCDRPSCIAAKSCDRNPVEEEHHSAKVSTA